ncbi:MAG: hypothetical protein H6632_08735 [Anaerolineales bacterium]|nr:hypothetical protein [Anaerolineales bacterium]
MLEHVYIFSDRVEAGRKLAVRLQHDPVIKAAAVDQILLLSIPYGGVVVGATAAEILGCRHDIIAAKKIKCPWCEEVIIGAVAEREVVTISKPMMHDCLHHGKSTGSAIEQAKAGVEDYISKFRAGRSLDLASKVVILVDDGIASGETIKAAIKWINSKAKIDRPQKLIVAVPICSHHIATEMRQLSDQFVCLSMPSDFWTVGEFYWDFSQVNDEIVHNHLTRWYAVPATS